MINYFRIILRRTLGNWDSFSTNVFGLSVGIAASFAILDHVGFETTYDNYHKNSDAVYRVIMNNYASTKAFVGPLIKNEFSEVVDFTRLHRASNDLAYENQQGGKISFYENNVFFADSSFFKFFSYELVKGNHNWVLKEPNSMVLTESSANKYFGTEEAIGKTVTLGNVVYEITGVVKDLPENTHLKFDVLISLVTWELHNPRPFEPATGLSYNGFFTYLMLD